MGLRFQKRICLMPGITLNFSKGGPSVSIGPRGVKVNISARGIRGTLGIPGTGLSYSVFQSSHEKKDSESSEENVKKRSVKKSSKQELIRLNLLKDVFFSVEEKKFAKAMNLLLEGDSDGALAGLDNLPNCPDADFTAAVMHLNRMEYESADAAIDRALAKQYSIGELYLKFEVHFHLSFPITDIFDVLIRPSPLAASLIKAETLQHTGRMQEAFELLLKLHIDDPQNPLVVISMMELSISAGTEDSGLLRKLIEMTEKVRNDSAVHAVMQYYRGIAMKLLGLYDAAQKTLTTAMSQRENRGDKLILAIMKERAEVYGLQNKPKSEKSMWEKVYAECPSDPDARNYLNLL